MHKISRVSWVSWVRKKHSARIENGLSEDEKGAEKEVAGVEFSDMSLKQRIILRPLILRGSRWAS
jgi:hypothetical protein